MQLLLIAIDTPWRIHASEIALQLPDVMEGMNVRSCVEVVDVEGASQSDILFAARAVRDGLQDQAFEVF